MADSGLASPVVVDGRVTDEKLNELLALQTEYPELDYKRRIDLDSTEGLVELVKDVGAMQVRGGYIVGGVDGNGVPTADMDGIDARPFDEANLVPKLRQYLPEPLEIRSRVLERDGHPVILIYVGRHPSGCAIFHTDGQYAKKKGTEIVFRAGDVYWRDGTRSVRISQQGFEEIMERRIADAKTAWLEEQREVRRREQADLRAAYETRGLAEGALGSVNFDLTSEDLVLAVLELIRADDAIALRHLLNDSLRRARSAIERDEIETELADTLDKLACLAASLVEYGRDDWFERVVEVLAEIYSMPLGPHDARRFGLSSHISPEERAPRVWLQIIRRVYALGALAVRRRNWQAVRVLSVQLPAGLDDYDANWLRHTLTMASRAQHLQRQKDGRTEYISLLSLAREDIERLTCLGSDLTSGDDDVAITSLAQFDFLGNVVAIDLSGDADSRVFYPNFARFRQERIQPTAEMLIRDPTMRSTLFPRGDDDLALALAAIAYVASREGVRYAGFDGWNRTKVGDFVEAHLPKESPS
jgi:hypothetical protein